MQAIDRIVFHIGAYKTGTTAIQQSLVDAHETLLTRGVLYLETGRRGPGLAQLAKDLAFGTGPVMKTPGHFALLEELRASGASTLVLSAEDFAGWPWTRCVAWARGICEQLQPRSVDVLAYVRPQWEYAETQYTQFVKNGKSSASFDEYVEESMDQETRFDYMTVFEPWREASGRRLEVRPYASELMFKGNAVEDFWHTVGLGSPPRTRNGSRQANRRPVLSAPRCSERCGSSWSTTISMKCFRSRRSSRERSGASAPSSWTIDPSVPTRPSSNAPDPLSRA
jgi:hypothetical protein